MMYFVALNLQGPDSDYEVLFKTIQSFGNWSNRIPSCWLVESRSSARAMRDVLKTHLKPGDRAFVGQFTEHWAATSMGDGFPDWMQRRNFEGGAVAVKAKA